VSDTENTKREKIAAVLRDSWIAWLNAQRAADELIAAFPTLTDAATEFRVIDSTRDTSYGQHVNITALPNLESAKRYIRRLDEDRYPVDGLVIESRGPWLAVPGGNA
jgi:hypothetical protein